jgi:hypothetical protein
VRAFAANDRDLRLVDLLETQHVAVHQFPQSSPLGSRAPATICFTSPKFS